MNQHETVMTRKFTIPDPSRIGDDTPLRLDVAAQLEFPDGSMTGSGLRREASNGRLVIERIAGKRHGADRALQQHIAGHAHEQQPRHAEPRRLIQQIKRQRRGDGRGHDEASFARDGRGDGGTREQV